MSETRTPAIYYGWHVAAAVGAIAFIAWGIGFYQLGVFVHALHEQRGWSLAALSVGPTIFYVVVGGANLVAGRVIDRYGPRAVLLAGACVLGVGMFPLGRAHSLWQVYLADAILAMGFACTSTLVLGAVIGRWFQRRRASVMTLALSGAPLGALVLVPLSRLLLDRFDIAGASALLGSLAVVVVLPLAFFVVRDDPAALGLTRDGAASAAGASRAGEAAWSVRAAARTRSWRLLTVSFAAIMFGQVAYLVHQVNFLSPIVGDDRAAGIVGITGAFGLLGRFAARLGDRLPKHHLMGGYCAVQGAAILLAATSVSPLLLAISAALVGFTMGNTVALQPVLMAEHFGMRSYGAVFGAASFLTQCAAALGLSIVGVLAERSGSYALPFVLTGTLALVAAAAAMATGGATHSVERPIPATN